MSNANIMIFIFTDEASEYDDTSSSKINTSRKHHDWAAQVESEQQHKTDYSTNSMIQSATLPRSDDRQRRRRSLKHGRPSLPVRKGLLAINIFFLLSLSARLTTLYLYL